MERLDGARLCCPRRQYRRPGCPSHAFLFQVSLRDVCPEPVLANDRLLCRPSQKGVFVRTYLKVQHRPGEWVCHDRVKHIQRLRMLR